MSNYEPQAGDRVRFTTTAGTTIEGILHHGANPDRWYAQDGYCLYDATAPEQTELLERPFKLNTEPGAVYGHPDPLSLAYRVVRVGPDDEIPWLGEVKGSDDSWFTHKEVEALVRDHGWAEYNLDGSRKNG